MPAAVAAARVSAVRIAAAPAAVVRPGPRRAVGGPLEDSLVRGGRSVDRAAEILKGERKVARHGGGGGVALVGILGQPAREHVAEPFPLRSARDEREVRILVGDLVHEGDDGIALVRLLARDQLVQDEPRREEVAPPVHRPGPHLLRRHVVRSAHEQAAAPRRAPEARDAEVHHLGRPPAGQEQVGRLHVAMDDAVVVRVSEAGQELEHDGKRRARVGPQSAFDRALEVDPLEQLHGDERRALVLAQLVDGDDVRVLETRHRARFAQEPLLVLRVRGPRAHDLQGHVAVERLVAAAEHHAHRALAHEVEHAEPADLRGDLHREWIILRTQVDSSTAEWSSGR